MEQTAAIRQQVAADIKTLSKFKSGANWFYWIAALSIINSIIVLSGKEWAFIVGLGVTQFIDAFGIMLSEEIGNFGKFLAGSIDVFIAGIFCLFGIFSRKKQEWAFIVGMILYGLDGLLFLVVGDFLSFGFHVFVLFFIYSGMKAMRSIENSSQTVTMPQTA